MAHDFGSPHETMDFKPLWCANISRNYPAAICGLYMKPVPEIQSACFCADLLAPECHGEIIGGSMREEDYDALVAGMEETWAWITEYEFT